MEKIDKVIECKAKKYDLDEWYKKLIECRPIYHNNRDSIETREKLAKMYIECIENVKL